MLLTYLSCFALIVALCLYYTEIFKPYHDAKNENKIAANKVTASPHKSKSGVDDKGIITWQEFISEEDYLELGLTPYDSMT